MIPCPVETCDRPRRGTEQICSACAGELIRALDAVPALARELDVTLARQTSTGTGGRSTEIPLPYDPRAGEAASVLRSALVGWVRAIWEGHEDTARVEGPRCRSCSHPSCRLIADLAVLTTRPADTLTSMAVWLSALHRRLVGHAAAEEAHGEIVAAVRAVRTVVDRPAPLAFAGRCPDCSTALYARPGRARATCRECGQRTEVADQLDQMRAAVEHQLAHSVAMAGLLDHLGVRVPAATIRYWAQAGRLVPHGRDQRGRPLYRVGDVLDLALKRPVKAG
ncbi:hypothetical protein SAMN04489712_105265 [Thermomonospora echinospora]|uniref:Uncharacterized protein n=1 Tax=Thermomonospora echinospora TaxID=1992 RepID=A0A1H6A7H6_9ACTN|nr:hypothetical protein [Thermomonospora echinospora]SEG44689.1 hypothetical protein SAMN04489712_105265 [Thermomonospora echinospora]